jgi:hypothetical protein
LFGQQGRQMRTETETKTEKLTINPKMLKMSRVHSSPSQVESNKNSVTVINRKLKEISI